MGASSRCLNAPPLGTDTDNMIFCSATVKSSELRKEVRARHPYFGKALRYRSTDKLINRLTARQRNRQIHIDI